MILLPIDALFAGEVTDRVADFLDGIEPSTSSPLDVVAVDASDDGLLATLRGGRRYLVRTTARLPHETLPAVYRVAEDPA